MKMAELEICLAKLEERVGAIQEDMKELKTDVKTLDDYIDKFKYQNIDFLKVDCQEHEKEIVLGSLKLLSEHNTVVCLELPLRNEAEKEYAKDVENILISY